MAIETNSDVADRVRGIAAEKRISRADIASILSVSPMAISRRLNGITPFTAEELIKLARRMNLSVASFFESTPSSNAADPHLPASGEGVSFSETVGARGGDAA